MTSCKWWVVAFLVAMTAAIAVHWPVLGFELTGDDYEWVQQAHEGCLRPMELLAPMGQFLRPMNIWILAVDRTIWGSHAAGFHLTTLIIHLITIAALLWAAAAVGLRPGTAAAVAVLWGCSPFTSENAVWTSIRHDDTLLVGWLLAIVAWPPPDARWTRVRMLGAAAGVTVAALSKETWIATPFLLVALELVRSRGRWRSALVFGGVSGVVAAAYVIVRLWIFPGTQGYFDWSPVPLAKIPHMFAAICRLEHLRPLVTTVSWRGVVASALVAVAAIVAWRWRSRPAIVGLALLLPPLGPTLFVPFQPQRYVAIPYAGFLLLGGGLLEAASRKLQPVQRRILAVTITVGALIVFATDVLSVRADLGDWQRISDVHSVLLEEARRVADDLPFGVPVAVIRAEHINLLQDIVDHPRGLEKLQFNRGSASYGLIDAGPLFDWVLDDGSTIVRSHPKWRTQYSGVAGRLLAHRRGGFVWISHADVSDLAAAASTWAGRGFPVQVITVEQTSPSEHPRVHP